MTDRVLAQIAALAKASLPDLKGRYRDLFGVEAPVTNRGYLERRLAYRLEALAQTADKGSSPRSRIKDRPLAVVIGNATASIRAPTANVA